MTVFTVASLPDDVMSRSDDLVCEDVHRAADTRPRLSSTSRLCLIVPVLRLVPMTVV